MGDLIWKSGSLIFLNNFEEFPDESQMIPIDSEGDVKVSVQMELKNRQF